MDEQLSGPFMGPFLLVRMASQNEMIKWSLASATTSMVSRPQLLTQLNMKNEENDCDTKRRISRSAARKMLGMVSKNYSDEDVEEVLDCLYAIAEEAFEEYANQTGHGE